jgi:hypothetical protein
MRLRSGKNIDWVSATLWVGLVRTPSFNRFPTISSYPQSADDSKHKTDGRPVDKVRAIFYRWTAPLAALVLFCGMSILHGCGNLALYEAILRWDGVAPFQFPFVDISGSLAAWECARQGVDVILSDPCDVLRRGYTYSPLWMAASPIPLGVADTTAVGWGLDLLFIASLGLLPPPRSQIELAFMLAATLSTMVAFALERANPDILLFMMTLMAGSLAECRLSLRLLGYSLALLAALLKYYPIMALIILFRERLPVFVAAALLILGSLAAFWAQYHVEIARGLPNIPRGTYIEDLFAAQNLPFLLGEAAAAAAQPSSTAPLVGQITGGALYAMLLGVSIAICRRLSARGRFSARLAALTDLERIFLVIGSAAITGCFFAGQSLGYRGVFLLFIMPGLLAVARAGTPEARRVGLGTAATVVFLMWGECLRLAINRAVEWLAVPDFVANEIRIFFWLTRELGWWWSVSVMLAVLADFLRNAPMLCAMSPMFDRSLARAK